MQLRSTNVKNLKNQFYDVLVIGGGINGAVSAASIAGQGASVALIDQGDFAGETSQASSNLVWGGIKYMESLEFSLVRKLCLSRNKLCRSFPSSVKEIRFFTIPPKGFRHPRVVLYLGAWMYWFIGNGFTRKPSIFSKNYIKKKEKIVNTDLCHGGMEYSDAYLVDNDARFVFHFIRSALRYGAHVANYVCSKGSTWSSEKGWATKVIDQENGEEFVIRSRALINACGPFVDEQNQVSNQKTQYQHILSKGIHLTVDRLTKHRHVLTFFADDGRMFFVIPMGSKSCIGTTDTRIESMPVKVTPKDREFVLENINKRLALKTPLQSQDIIAERCGVRPLAVKKNSGNEKADWLTLSRKHIIEVHQNHMSIFGGKLTDCLNVGNEVCGELRKMGISFRHLGRKWYGESPLQSKENFLFQAKAFGIHEKVARRWWRYYDIEAHQLLEEIRRDPAMKEELLPEIGYQRCEAVYARKQEMIIHLEDLLRRRTPLAMISSTTDLSQQKGLKEVCRILFAKEAEKKFHEYFREK